MERIAGVGKDVASAARQTETASGDAWRRSSLNCARWWDTFT